MRSVANKIGSDTHDSFSFAFLQLQSASAAGEASGPISSAASSGTIGSLKRLVGGLEIIFITEAGTIDVLE